MNKIKFLLLSSICIIAILSVGCITTPYSRPSNLPLQKLLRIDSVKADTNQSLADLSWHILYADTNLQLLIKEALDSNSDIKLAINKIEQQKQYVKQSNASFFPSLNIGLNASLLSYSNQSFTGSRFAAGSAIIPDIQLGLSTSWEIDIWGKLQSARKSKQAILMQQQSLLHATQTQIIASIASMYYQLIILDNQKKITLDNIKSYAHYLSTVESLKASAQTNEVAVLQAKAQLANAKAYLPQIESLIASNENNICSILSKVPSSIKRSNNIDVDKIFGDSLSIGVPIQLLSNRPDVQASEQALISAHQLYNIAKASMYPQLILSGNIGLDATNILNWFKLPGSLLWNLVGGITQPLFNARQLKTQKQIAKLQEEYSLITFKQTILNAGAEVSTTLSNIHYYTQQVFYQRQEVENLQKAYEYSQQLLVDGYASYLDVLLAQNKVLSSYITLYNTYNNIVQQKIILYRALGGGWQ